MALKFLQISNPRELSLFDMSGGSKEDPIFKAVFFFFELIQSLPVVKGLVPWAVCQRISQAIH